MARRRPAKPNPAAEADVRAVMVRQQAVSRERYVRMGIRPGPPRMSDVEYERETLWSAGVDAARLNAMRAERGEPPLAPVDPDGIRRRLAAEQRAAHG